MAPLISTILKGAISLGPSVLRLFGQNKGSNVQNVTEAVASLIENSGGNPPRNLVEQELNKLTHDELSALSVELQKIAAEREKTRLNYDAGMHTEQQKTIRSSIDLKRVRPEIANRHSWFTCAYILGAEIAKALGEGQGASLEVAAAIAAPTLAFFGFRTWDKFSPQGASK